MSLSCLYNKYDTYLSLSSRWLDYCHNYLVSPILQLFQQLRLKEVEDDMFSHAEQNNDGERSVIVVGL